MGNREQDVEGLNYLKFWWRITIYSTQECFCRGYAMQPLIFLHFMGGPVEIQIWDLDEHNNLFSECL